MARLAAALIFLAVASSAAAPPRSHTATAAFKKLQPCPATGQTHGACPGYVIDHVVALCAGGSDEPANMQWQTLADAKAKDRLEWAQCRSLRKNKP